MEPDDVRAFEPAEARLLSTGSPTKDEDPIVVAGPDGAQDIYYRLFRK
jgi:hypothetical protein